MRARSVQDIAIRAIDRDESNIAIELLIRAFQEDPTCGFLFHNTSPKYFGRMRAFFEAGNRDHFAAGQPVLGMFSGSNLIGVVYFQNPGAEFTSWAVLRWLALTKELGCAYRLLKYVLSVKRRAAPLGKHCTVVLIGVDPDHQGQGYGSTLMRRVHDLCRQSPDCSGVLLDTGNPRNIRFYEDLGYREIASFRLGQIHQRIMFRYQEGPNTAPLDKITELQEMSSSSSISLTSDLTFDASIEMPHDFIALVENVRWGTQGVLYRVKNYQATVQALPNRLHLQVRKSGKLVAARIAIRKSCFDLVGATDAFYHSLFSVDPSEQGKGYGKVLARCTLDHLTTLLKSRGFIYAYIEEGNIRSAAIAASAGYRRFGHFYAHPISRLFPRSSQRVGRPDDGRQHAIKKLLEQRYKGHALTDFSLSFNPSEYWVLHEEGLPIAGVQVSPQLWQIEQLPGLSGTIAVKIVPRVPLLCGLFNPAAWRFLKLGNIYFLPGRPNALLELIEDLLYRYQMKTAALYIDHRSPIYEELRKSEHFGILDPLMKTKVDVWGFLDYLSSQQISELHNSPLAISPLDV